VVLLLAGFSSPAQLNFIACLAALPLFEVVLAFKLLGRVSLREVVLPELPILARLSDRAPPLA
jgi:membrane-associated HD superfamily phosphohydrolase